MFPCYLVSICLTPPSNSRPIWEADPSPACSFWAPLSSGHVLGLTTGRGWQDQMGVERDQMGVERGPMIHPPALMLASPVVVSARAAFTHLGPQLPPGTPRQATALGGSHSSTLLLACNSSPPLP